MELHFPHESECTFSLSVEESDIPVRGNALSSGDDKEDERVENEIIARLDDGDAWAWADVTVVCYWNGFTGTDSLGGCCYTDEADFRQPGGYFDDMKVSAHQNMCHKIEDSYRRMLPLLK